MKRTYLLIAVCLSITACRTTRADSDETIFVSGRIDGDTVDLSSKRSGRITEIAVREGDTVTAGQVLAVLASEQDQANYEQQTARITSDEHKLDQLRRQLATYTERVRQAQITVDQAKMDAPAKVKEAEANLASRRAELARSEAELIQSQTDAERYAPLAKSGAVAVQLAEQYRTKLQIAQASTDANRRQVAAAEASLEAAKAQLENPRIKESDRKTLEREVDELKAQIAAAQADIEAGRAALRHIEADLQDLKIVAPIAGTILTRSAEPGRVMAPGQTILTMVDLEKLYLRGFVPEGNVGKVKVGQRAKVYLDSNPNEVVPAEVIRIDPQAMFTPENTYFKDDRVKQVLGLKLGLKGAFGFAKPGMPADGEIEVGSN